MYLQMNRQILSALDIIPFHGLPKCPGILLREVFTAYWLNSSLCNYL